MRVNRKFTWFAGCVLLILFTCGATVAEDPKSIVATANGEGSIKFGKEELKIYAVVVKLFEDGKAEINLVTDISVFINGTWSRASDTAKAVDIKVTGGSVSGNLTGTGKIALTEDRKSITSLTLEVINASTRKTIRADFVAK